MLVYGICLPPTLSTFPDLSLLFFLSLSVPPCDSFTLLGSPKHISAALGIVLPLLALLLNSLPELERGLFSFLLSCTLSMVLITYGKGCGIVLFQEYQWVPVSPYYPTSIEMLLCNSAVIQSTSIKKDAAAAM